VHPIAATLRRHQDGAGSFWSAATGRRFAEPDTAAYRRLAAGIRRNTLAAVDGAPRTVQQGGKPPSLADDPG